MQIERAGGRYCRLGAAGINALGQGDGDLRTRGGVCYRDAEYGGSLRCTRGGVNGNSVGERERGKGRRAVCGVGVLSFRCG
jgi:hypothetical protein